MMARDALDAAGGTYPYWPRTATGEWDTARMPVGPHRQGGVLVDLTPRDTDGTPIVPPDLTLPATCQCSTHKGT